jgi:hypothetical protein
VSAFPFKSLDGSQPLLVPCGNIGDKTEPEFLKHFKVTAEKAALGKVNFSCGILTPDSSLTAVCHCGQETYSLATGLNAAVLVILIERQLVCLKVVSSEN